LLALHLKIGHLDFGVINCIKMQNCSNDSRKAWHFKNAYIISTMLSAVKSYYAEHRKASGVDFSDIFSAEIGHPKMCT
jgi:hypothetical protein